MISYCPFWIETYLRDPMAKVGLTLLSRGDLDDDENNYDNEDEGSGVPWGLHRFG